MKTITTFLLLAVCQLCFAGVDTNVIAMSDWSKPVGTAQGQSLRVRMLIVYGRGACFDGPGLETQFYLELQNASCTGEPMQIYFDPSHQLRCDLLDASGKSVTTPRPGSVAIREGSGDWITLPYDSTIRLRVNPGGYGNKKGDGLNLYLWPSGAWNLRAGDTNNYYLTGTFTVASQISKNYSVTGTLTPRDSELFRSGWNGTIELPKMKISVNQP